MSLPEPSTSSPPLDAAPRRNLFATVLALGAAVAFAAFPVLRPWGDSSGAVTDMARAFASPRWLAAHLCGAAGWVLLAAAAAELAAHRGGRRLRWGAGLLSGGVAAILLYYGTEAFALHALGSIAVQSGDMTSLDAAQSAIRYGTTATLIFGLGLASTAAGAIFLASASSPWWAAVPMAVLIAAYLPQFFAPNGMRIAHGLLLGMALALWALRMGVQRAPTSSSPPPAPLAGHSTTAGRQPW